MLNAFPYLGFFHGFRSVNTFFISQWLQFFEEIKYYKFEQMQWSCKSFKDNKK